MEQSNKVPWRSWDSSKDATRIAHMMSNRRSWFFLGKRNRKRNLQRDLGVIAQLLDTLKVGECLRFTRSWEGINLVKSNISELHRFIWTFILTRKKAVEPSLYIGRARPSGCDNTSRQLIELVRYVIDKPVTTCQGKSRGSSIILEASWLTKTQSC